MHTSRTKQFPSNRAARACAPRSGNTSATNPFSPSLRTALSPLMRNNPENQFPSNKQLGEKPAEHLHRRLDCADHPAGNGGCVCRRGRARPHAADCVASAWRRQPAPVSAGFAEPEIFIPMMLLVTANDGSRLNPMPGKIYVLACPDGWLAATVIASGH